MSKTTTRRAIRRPTGGAAKLLRSYWLWLGIGATFIVVGLLAMAASSGAPSGGGDRAPDFRLASLDGGQVTLGDYRGRYVLVNFWATWCPPCRAELPDLAGFYHEYADQGFVLLGVNEGESAATAGGYLSSAGLDFPVLLDLNGSVMARYGVTGMPSSFLVDPDGQVLRRWTGMLDRRTLETAVAPLLGG